MNQLIPENLLHLLVSILHFDLAHHGGSMIRLNGLERWREAVTETAGYYNTVGFIDDTRAFASIPVRHDVARRFDSGYLAREVTRQRITENEAMELAADLAYNLSKDFFNL
jgi:glucuronate isomerase